MENNLEKFFKDKFRQAERDNTSQWNLPSEQIFDRAIHRLSLNTKPTERNRVLWLLLVLLCGIIGGQYVYYQHKLEDLEEKINAAAFVEPNSAPTPLNQTPGGDPVSDLKESVADRVLGSNTDTKNKSTGPTAPPILTLPDEPDLIPPADGVIRSGHTSYFTGLLPAIQFELVKNPEKIIVFIQPRSFSSNVLPVSEKQSTWQIGMGIKSGLARLTMQVPQPSATMLLTRYDEWQPLRGLALTSVRSISQALQLRAEVSYTRYKNLSHLHDEYSYNAQEELTSPSGQKYYLTQQLLATPIGDAEMKMGFVMNTPASRDEIINETAMRQYLHTLALQVGPELSLPGRKSWRWQIGGGGGIHAITGTKTKMDITLSMQDKVMLEATEQPTMQTNTRHNFLSAYIHGGWAVNLTKNFSWHTDLRLTQGLSSLRLKPDYAASSTYLQEIAFKTGIYLKIN